MDEVWHSSVLYFDNENDRRHTPLWNPFLMSRTPTWLAHETLQVPTIRAVPLRQIILATSTLLLYSMDETANAPNVKPVMS
jgi:hypothetical protein